MLLYYPFVRACVANIALVAIKAFSVISIVI